MSNDDLFQRVKELKLPTGKYVLFGSAPLGIRGLKNCHDIDVVVTEDLWGEFVVKDGWVLKTGPSGDEYLWNNDIELWRGWKPGEWDISELINEAEIINGLPFVKLDYVVECKKLSAREKDLKDIAIIEKFLRTKK